jgi:hypothetical protein
VEQVGNPGADQHGRLDGLRQRATTGQVRIVHILFGYAVANRFFWVAPRKGKPTWTDVHNRVDWLARRDKAAAVHFVQVSLDRTTLPGVVLGLARYGLSRDVVRDWLTALVADPELLWPRVEHNGALAGGFAGAARVLLDPDMVRTFVTWLAKRYDVIPVNLVQTMDTVGYRFTAADDLDSRIRTHEESRHRLVITESLDDCPGIDTMLFGAKKVTLLATSDTYGRADVGGFRTPKGTDLTVEHVRSRITRFSQDYVDLHDATAEVAKQLAEAFFRRSELIDAGYRQSIEVSLADYLFFTGLRMKAVDVLLDDADFDHIVLATDNHTDKGAFIRQLAGIDRLCTDPRVELISVSRTASSFRKFWDLADAIARGNELRPERDRPRIPGDLIRQKFLAEAYRRAKRLPDFAADRQKPAVLLVTANNAAYNKATAAYAAELRDAGDVRVVHFGAEPGNLVDLLDAQATQRGRIPMTVLAPQPGAVGSLPLLVAEAMGPALAEHQPGPEASQAQRVAWGAANADMERLSRTVAMTLLQLQAVNAWFDRMAEDGTLPDAVVLTPHRHSGVGAFAAAARLHGVPSIAVEPHAQDANYCRYMKVGADYYGVLSEYFRDHTASTHGPGGFGIGADRIRPLGSPRQIAPSDHGRAKARAAALEELRAKRGLRLDEGQFLLGFFSQPSSWDGIRPVWSAVLEATRKTGSTVLLKPHPEDSPSRIRQYLAAAEQDEVVVFQGDVATAIDASDLVTTTYSIVGLDATLRGAPVVALADGDADYPLDLASILGVPVVRSAAELAKTIEAFKADPTPFTERTERFLAEESQFVEGPGPRLRQLLSEVVQQGTAGIRPASDVPEHYFLDGPHPVFPV